MGSRGKRVRPKLSVILRRAGLQAQLENIVKAAMGVLKLPRRKRA